MKRILLLAAAVVVLAGCARHVVVDPGQAASFNSADWTVKSQPQAAEPGTKNTR